LGTFGAGFGWCQQSCAWVKSVCEKVQRRLTRRKYVEYATCGWAEQPKLAIKTAIGNTAGDQNGNRQHSRRSILVINFATGHHTLGFKKFHKLWSWSTIQKATQKQDGQNETKTPSLAAATGGQKWQSATQPAIKTGDQIIHKQLGQKPCPI
jgi:hypothetical protein